MGDKNKNKGLDEQNQQMKEEKNQGEGQTSQETSNKNNTTDATIQELAVKIEQIEKERDNLKDKYLRKAAEFENYKRRTEQEFAALSKYATEQLIIDILPVIDDFERSLHVSKNRREFGPFYKGIELIYQKFMQLLESKGVKPIEVEGKPFNVDLHDALMQVPKDNIEPNTIIEEVERGYLYDDKVIRHAKVVVAKEPETDETAHDGTSGEEVNKKENK